jgi:hypothetical protein
MLSLRTSAATVYFLLANLPFGHSECVTGGDHSLG